MYRFLLSTLLFMSTVSQVTARTTPTNLHQRRQLPFGPTLSTCTTPNTIALTFDNGPSVYTSQLLNILNSHNIKATFFILGNSPDRGPIDASPSLSSTIQSMVESGHQVASHTYTHADLSTLSPDSIHSEISSNEEAVFNIIGKRPRFFRPPYLSCNGVCEGVLGEMGMVNVGTSLDTDDWKGDLGVSRDIIEGGLGEGKVVLMHDILEGTVGELVEFMVGKIEERGLRAVTVGECMGVGSEGWYK